MIFAPRPGQAVRVHYAKEARGLMPYHGREGTVVCVGRRAKMRNVGVLIDGTTVVVSRGHLVRIEGEKAR